MLHTHGSSLLFGAGACRITASPRTTLHAEESRCLRWKAGAHKAPGESGSPFSDTGSAPSLDAALRGFGGALGSRAAPTTGRAPFVGGACAGSGVEPPAMVGIQGNRGSPWGAALVGDLLGGFLLRTLPRAAPKGRP